MTRIDALVYARAAAVSGEARTLRLAADLSLIEVAAEVGKDRKTVSRWELGRTKPRGGAGVRYGQLLLRLRDAEGVTAQ